MAKAWLVQFTFEEESFDQCKGRRTHIEMMTGLEIELLDGSRVILAGRAQDVGQPGYMFLMRGDEIEALEDPNLRPKVERILAGKCEVLWKCRDFSDDAAICLAARMRDRRRFLDSKLTALRVLDEEREEYLRGDVPF